MFCLQWPDPHVMGRLFLEPRGRLDKARPRVTLPWGFSLEALFKKILPHEATPFERRSPSPATPHPDTSGGPCPREGHVSGGSMAEAPRGQLPVVSITLMISKCEYLRQEDKRV